MILVAAVYILGAAVATGVSLVLYRLGVGLAGQLGETSQVAYRSVLAASWMVPISIRFSYVVGHLMLFVFPLDALGRRKTEWIYPAWLLLAWVVYSGVATVEDWGTAFGDADVTFELSKSIILGMGILIWIGWHHFFPQDVIEGKTALYLRRFSPSDRRVLASLTRAIGTKRNLLLLEAPDAQRRAFDPLALGLTIFLSPIGRHANPIPLRSGEQWQEAVERLVADAPLVVIDIRQDSEALRWELDLARRSNAHRTLVLGSETKRPADLPENMAYIYCQSGHWPWMRALLLSLLIVPVPMGPLFHLGFSVSQAFVASMLLAIFLGRRAFLHPTLDSGSRLRLKEAVQKFDIPRVDAQQKGS